MGKVPHGGKWNRFESAGHLDDFQAGDDSIRGFSRWSGVPRTSLQHWLYRAKRMDMPESAIRFFESLEGQEFLHALFVSMILELHERGNCSLEALSRFLRSTKLDRFVPSSKSSLAGSCAELEKAVADFASVEHGRMAAEMPEKQISVAQDETFPSGVCLVAIEPVSNFILLEEMADDRTTKTWDERMCEALAPLPVTVVQGVGDESKSLVKHVREGLCAHHSPDTFHIQQELTRGASAQLRLKVKRESVSLEHLKKETSDCERRKKDYEGKTVRPRGRPPAFDDHAAKARLREMEQVEKVREAMEAEKTFHAARREVSGCYHPYDLSTGLPQSPEKVESRLDKAFERIQKVTAHLPDVFKKKIEKAKRRVGDMKSTIIFFTAMVGIYLDNKRFDPHARMLLEDILIPASYLRQAASKIQDKAARLEVSSTVDLLTSDFNRGSGPFELYGDAERKGMLEAAEECAAFFQRSSSAVEGRNGQLSLKHHNLHRLTGRKLKCLTALHNFHTKRKDGTTPAQRFFENKHPNLFEHLLKTLKPPGRPRIATRLAMAA